MAAYRVVWEYVVGNASGYGVRRVLHSERLALSKEQRNSLRMILGSKHVAAILSVLVWNFI